MDVGVTGPRVHNRQDDELDVASRRPFARVLIARLVFSLVHYRVRHRACRLL